MKKHYPLETLDPDEDCGVMPENVEELSKAVIGHRIVSAETRSFEYEVYRGSTCTENCLVLTLDNGRQVAMSNTSDCCAYTGLNEFFLDPAAVDHVIMGVGTTDRYSTWHIYADFGDIMRLDVGWSCGNPFYYGYGFDILVKEITDNIAVKVNG